uniref:Luciferin 4-monooxygenase n=1 Tax=Heliothis virescens TaxID=7102 RepID=A0A2A4JUE1_HELVI
MKLAPFDVKNENYNLGHLCLDGIRSGKPDAIFQIDAGTGKCETYGSVLARTVQLARCFRKFGAKPGDVLALGGDNHLDLHIPYYAALMNGYPLTGVDPLFKHTEIKKLFKICSPRIAFCQKDLLETYSKVVEELGLNTEIICFDEGDRSMANFIKKYDDNDGEEFLPVILDRNKKYAWLISTGGTTGVVKLAAITHMNIMMKFEHLKVLFPKPTDSTPSNGDVKVGLNLSPVQWISAFYCALSMPLHRQIKLQTSKPHTAEHIVDMINQYKPINAFLSPSLASALLKCEKKCDFSCFDLVMLSGGKVHLDIHLEMRKRVRPGVPVAEMYGQTENLGAVFIGGMKGPIGNCGLAVPELTQIKLVDPETGKEVTEPNVPGELWTKGPSFTEYYNNPEETAESFTKDGWYKTGDILYKDVNGYFFFVERLKMLIKYRSYHIIPPEIEAVIREHPAVFDVSVTSIPHKEDGEHAVACVMRKPGANVTADEIKELVASKLSDSQKLRGGVIFMDQIPLTSTGKVARGKLRQLVLTLDRE